MNGRAKWLGIGAMATFTLAVAALPARAEWENPKIKPPAGKPSRISAAEGIPPLPLPATPLRRSEKKRQPAPPALVGMINFDAEAKIVNGRRQAGGVMPTTQVDIERLMNYANQRLDIRYRFVGMTLGGFSWDPSELPLLYVTGWTPMPQLSDDMMEKLRRYLYDGGTLVFHAQCGRPEFNDSVVPLIARLLPNRKLSPLDSDSPLFHAYFNIDKMQIRQDDKPLVAKAPYLEAVYLGCRPAVIYSPIDLNCSWDVVNNPIQGGMLYHQDDGMKLGVNIITTVLADFQYARAWGTEKVYHEQAERTRDQLVIAQIVHEGDWDPTPHALPNLMKYIQKNTTLNVQFKRETVNLSDVDVYRHPVLYMTGLRGFKFNDAQVARLQSYLKAGGVLVADAAAGNKAFDQAFRQEIKRVLPNDELKLLPPDAPIYQTPCQIRAVDYTDLAKAQSPTLNAPTLEGIAIDGQLAVVYSQFSLSNGWEQLGFAYNRGYGDADALRLGVNVFAYALTH